MKTSFIFLVSFFWGINLPAYDLYVSPQGSDSAAGNSEAPFATVARAQAFIRAMKTEGGLPSGGVTVWLKDGYHLQTEPLVLEAIDSGTLDRPVIYASPPGERAHITSARVLDPAWFTPVDGQSEVWSRFDPTARGQVLSIDLRAHGITEYGVLKSRGFVLSEPAPLELFFNGQPMTLARWPNRNSPLAQTAGAPNATQMVYSGSRPERWNQAQDVWMHGLWSETWADYHLEVARIDPEAKTISFTAGPAQFGIRPERPYYAYNLLEEIDEPGEYYLDRGSGILYFWPTASLTGASILVSMSEKSIFQFEGASNVTLRNLVIEASRGTLLTVNAGSHLRFEQCTLRNAGQSGALLAGTENGLDFCEIADCGEEGVRLTGGNRVSLLAGNNFVSNSQIRRTGAAAWTYKPGINFDGGCGNIASHNLLEDMPHSAILFSGNNHRIEFNEITRVCQATSDAGAIYSGHDWGYRGNVIQFNFLHHIQSSLEGYGAHGVYLDDCVSGVEVTSNIFYRVSNTAIFCGGGRDNLLRNNIVALSGTAHENDDRGRFRINNTPGDYWNLLERLRAGGIRYRDEPWASAYPACAAIPESWDDVQQGLWRNPENSVFSNNVGWGNRRWTAEQNSSGTGVFATYAALADNVSEVTPLFDEAASLDRNRRSVTLNAGSPGFQPVPFAAVGPSAPLPPKPTQPPVGSDAIQIEAESLVTIISDVGSNGSVGTADGNLDSGESVRLYDAGDAVRISFHTQTPGTYRVGVRVRSGGTTGPAVFWPDGYRFKLDGSPLATVGDPTTISEIDSAYGGCYWGTMLSAPMTLAAGTHTVDVEAATNWAVVDFVRVTPVASSSESP